MKDIFRSIQFFPLWNTSKVISAFVYHANVEFEWGYENTLEEYWEWVRTILKCIFEFINAGINESPGSQDLILITRYLLTNRTLPFSTK
jgi:hypothetical protein